MTIDSSYLLKELHYDFYSFVEPEIEPETTDVSFADLLPELEKGGTHSRRIASSKLYKHQLEAYEALRNGKNLVLISGAGSGKTEAWFLYSALGRKRTLVIYPTLALSNDQIRRIGEYSTALGLKSDSIDSLRAKELRSRLGTRKMKEHLASLDVLITNPAFLLNDLKKWPGGKSLLYQFATKMDLFVIDEFDFYGPREIALLVSMVRIMKLLLPKGFQIAVLTATLGNPEEMSSLLSSINERDTSVVSGKPFRVENRVYIVLGKDLRSLWLSLRERKDEILSEEVGDDIRKALEDFERFKLDFYKVIEAARYAGIEPPSVEVDVSEIIASYARDDGVTIVFTRSIRGAEELYRRTLLRLKGEREGEERIATHHHLVSKKARILIEAGAREGRIKVIVSPRTLAQGIDIGNVVRIVHVGLPEDVREFRQKEGRKGRRKELPFTETIILPVRRWDRELLLRGVKALRKWIELPLEKALVNPENKYCLLFEGLFKFVKPELRDRLTEEELSLLSELKLISKEGLTDRGKRTWRNMNFYEFGPPYGMKRMKKEDDTIAYLEDIGHCDLVERFQPGCIDYSADAIVVDLLRKGRVVTGVVEEHLSMNTVFKYDPLAFAYEEYEKTKHSWGEEPNVIKDYYTGRLHSEVICVVDPPRDGFGIKVKVPNRVYWTISSRRSRPVSVGDRTYFIRDRKSLPVLGPTGGVYRDYTYGTTVELDPSEDIIWSRVGMALVLLVLRLYYGIPFDAIYYEVVNVGDRKLLLIHEPDSAGLIEKLDWGEISKRVEEFEPDDLSEILLQTIDDQAHFELLSSGMRWDLAKRYAKRMLEYLMLREKIRIRIGGREILVPKPSRALKTASFDFITLPISENVSLGCSALFDGEESFQCLLSKEFFETRGWEEMSKRLSSLVDRGFSIVIYDASLIRRALTEFGLTSASILIEGLRREGRLIEVSGLAKRVLGMEIVPFEELVRTLGWETATDLVSLRKELERSSSLLKERGEFKWPYFTKYLRRTAEDYLKASTINLYKIYYVLRGLERQTELSEP